MQRHIYFILEREASKMPRRDRIRDEIVAFAERQDWIVRKADGGYSIYKEPGKPIARLKADPQGRYEVKRWTRRQRWDSLGQYHLMADSLEEALDIVDRNPGGWFRGARYD